MPGFVITKPIKLKETKTKSGIIIQQGDAKRGRLEETQHGTVVEVSYESEQDKDKYGISVGDTIVYGEYAGFESDIERQRYRFIDLRDIRAVITK